MGFFLKAVVAELRDAANEVSAGTWTKAAFLEMQKLYGFNHDEFNLLHRLQVRAISALVHDWFHIYRVTDPLLCSVQRRARSPRANSSASSKRVCSLRM